MLIIILGVVYLHFSYAFEFSDKHSVASNLRPEVYYPVLGVILAITYVASIYLVQEIEIEDKYQVPFISSDALIILVYVLMEAVLMFALYLSFMIFSKYLISFIIFVVFLVINFALAGFAIKYSKDG